MEILENRDAWRAEFEAGWLAHLKATGEQDWPNYNRPKNTTAPSGKAIKLSESKIVLIPTAGSYLPDVHEPFDDQDPLGDYSIRLYPTSTPLDALAYSHPKYNHEAVEKDPQVLIPLRHLEDMVNEGIIGGLAEHVVSVMGYQPDVSRTLDETIPAVIEAVKKEDVQGALLVPA
ncbi:MAG: hypothetical protein D6737_04665 [Chloroflexi bacterium]|nr:MAG: hypothetical protein CUN54_08790 [Phototrophicales bacterium]RMF81556.1 MAG: hypothetical protein D6737_04665 [Chloroflexota bacterium]